MASPIFNAIGNGGNNPFAIVEQFINFANNFKGNPQQEVQKLLHIQNNIQPLGADDAAAAKRLAGTGYAV